MASPPAMRPAPWLRTVSLASLALLLCAPASAQQQPVQSFALNDYKAVLDGQWQGIRYASDGNVYFASSTHSAHHGAAFFKYSPATGQVTMLAEDLTLICGEDPQTNPQGKMHSDIVEANGWLYMTTHFSSELPGAYDNWSGSHLIGYELATGTFRDYGVVHANYTSYSGIGVDPARNRVYVYVTGLQPHQVSYIYRIDTVSGLKTNLGEVGISFNHMFWTFVDRRGDVWFSGSSQNGALRRIRAASDQIDLFPNALPPLQRWDAAQVNPSANDQANRWIMWMQPLDGNRALFTMGYFGGGLYVFDSSKPIGSGEEFQLIQHIGYSDLGLAVGGNRVFYNQRANRGFGHQGYQDFHLLSVSLDPATGHSITDHGLLVDQNGRLVWRAPGLMTDGQNKVFIIGDWGTVPGDVGSLRYTYSGGTETYEPLPRGQFFGVANTDTQGAPASLASLTLSPTSVYGSITTTSNRISLTAPAPPGGLVVTLSSDEPSLATPPASALIPAGATISPEFSITTQPVTVDRSVAITATFGPITRTATLVLSAVAPVNLTLPATSLTAAVPAR